MKIPARITWTDMKFLLGTLGVEGNLDTVVSFHCEDATFTLTYVDNNDADPPRVVTVKTHFARSDTPGAWPET